MRKYALLFACAALPAVFIQTSSPTQAQTAIDAKLRLVAELTEAGGGALVLDVTFYGTSPKPEKADLTLRRCLEAATVMHPDENIAARAWFRASATSSKRQAVSLVGGAESLLYVAKDRSIRSAGDDSAPATDAAAVAPEDVAAILGNEKIVKACRKFPQDQLPLLAGAGLEMRGQKRKDIVKAMRAWCRENDVVKLSKARGCISSIAKVVVAMKSSTGIGSGEIAAAISRGEASFTGDNHCASCHGIGGRGGLKAPNLSDDKWLHCDGSIEGIKKVILSGVPRNKLKDSSRPFPMHPATNLASNAEELADLAAYVHSLSRR